ncbi:hypothetical protein L1987_30160 [Smallanthus sonchifolius]|uniref:Uncharacterized protein n=1 Tax=Smallanthus sonchifolius TaxID=185202 RepID=A0ACB9I2P0_9ASTR|nr:hypothetical protein L1987_30160 [Smallanthus sonchifolius]
MGVNSRGLGLGQHQRGIYPPFIQTKPLLQSNNKTLISLSSSITLVIVRFTVNLLCSPGFYGLPRCPKLVVCSCCLDCIIRTCFNYWAVSDLQFYCMLHKSTTAFSMVKTKDYDICMCFSFGMTRVCIHHLCE